MKKHKLLFLPVLQLAAHKPDEELLFSVQPMCACHSSLKETQQLCQSQ